MSHLTKEQIITASEKIFVDFSTVCKNVDDNIFFKRIAANKWSIAENVQHLIISTKVTTLAYSLPAFIVGWVGGKPNRQSRDYEALVEKYKQKLAAGGKASGIFVPKPMKITADKEKLLAGWDKATAKYIAALQNSTNENKLDNYLARHPLLGRVTLRELCYFTIYHTQHHLTIINNINSAKP
jgi:DinB superfamily